LRRISKQAVVSWISLTFFCFQLLMILSLLVFLIVKGSQIRSPSFSKDRINQRQMFAKERIHGPNQKLMSIERGEPSVEGSLKSEQKNLQAIQESIKILNQKLRSDEQRQRSLGEMKYFVLEILVTAILIVLALLFFNSAINSESIMSIRYRILIGHIMAFVIALVLPFLANGLLGLLFTAFPSAFEILLTFSLITTVRYFSKSFFLTRIFPLDLFLTGITLWIVSFLVVVGFEAFLQNDFVTYPLKLMLILGFFGGFGLNIFFLRKEY
jgi:hypothetical protein